MNAHDLPGFGDRATWGHHAADPRSPDFEGDAPDATAQLVQAVLQRLEKLPER